MTEVSNSKQAVATWRWAWQLLGIMVGTATFVSLIKHGFAIELSGLPAKVYGQYTWLRDMVFEPAVWLVSWIGLTIPPWLKDVITVYGLIGAAFVRAMTSTGIPLTTKESLLKYYLVHLSFVMSWPLLAIFVPVEWVQYRNHPEYRDGAPNFLKAFGWQLMIVVVAAVAFFLWNHLANVYGPG